ncbi:hypothetical protein Gohar_027429 [Gossypium harknessii]|uniref:RNase H type-1 domain-containing protein n=1 Tax=Gossypium harknessii TaxID=34285 RepID=A0A7J9HXH4_9ROSI|nr:hypothetical protein [Gossypium harknessii]
MVERWCRPDLDFIKINFDAAFNNHTKESCSGLAVQMRLNLGYRKVIIGGDSHSIIRKMQIEQDDISVISTYVKDLKEHTSLLHKG